MLKIKKKEIEKKLKMIPTILFWATKWLVVPFGETGRETKVGKGEGIRILFGLCEIEKPSGIQVERSHKHLDR